MIDPEKQADSAVTQKKKGTSGLRIDLNVPGSRNPGLNI